LQRHSRTAGHPQILLDIGIAHERVYGTRCWAANRHGNYPGDGDEAHIGYCGARCQLSARPTTQQVAGREKKPRLRTLTSRHGVRPCSLMRERARVSARSRHSKDPAASRETGTKAEPGSRLEVARHDSGDWDWPHVVTVEGATRSLSMPAAWRGRQ